MLMKIFPALKNVNMWVLWPETVTLICGGMLIATLIFIVYGCIVGFENTLVNEPPPGGGADPS